MWYYPHFPELEAFVQSLPFDIDAPETLGQIEDFAKVTHFRQFYADHLDVLQRANRACC